MLGLNVPIQWDRDKAIAAGARFLKSHEKLSQKDMRAANGLPSCSVINKLFGSLGNYQEEIGIERNHKNDRISKEEIRQALNSLFEGRERVIESQGAFFEEFVYSQSTILKRYGDFWRFCEEENITVLNAKKARYSKDEVDRAISAWVKEGNPIPKVHDLSKVGLPSAPVILRYYENWKEPFVMYSKIHEVANR